MVGSGEVGRWDWLGLEGKRVGSRNAERKLPGVATAAPCCAVSQLGMTLRFVLQLGMTLRFVLQLGMTLIPLCCSSE